MFGSTLDKCSCLKMLFSVTGNIVYAMDYSVLNPFNGLANLNEYPFEDSDGTTTQQCETAGKNVTVQVFNPNVVVTYSDTTSAEQRVQLLKSATAQQPVSVALNANCQTFQSYSGGVITDDGNCACDNVNCIDHAVLLVGYNDTNNPPFFKLKNSWVSNRKQCRRMVRMQCKTWSDMHLTGYGLGRVGILSHRSTGRRQLGALWYVG